MFLRTARRIGRVFAIALLAWTAVDLIDYRACQNHGTLPSAASPAAIACLAAGGEPPSSPHHRHGAPAGHAGDCFCCSAFVDVQTPFHLWVTSSGVSLEGPPATEYVSATQAHLYRPPIPA